MTTELTYLVYVCLFTSILWMPYILNRLAVGPGLVHEVGYPDTDTVLSPWAARLKKAHSNAIENLAVFAPLLLATHVAGISNELTELAAIGYFAARVAHALAYVFAIPWARTLAFSGSFAAQAALAYSLLTT